MMGDRCRECGCKESSGYHEQGCSRRTAPGILVAVVVAPECIGGLPRIVGPNGETFPPEVDAALRKLEGLHPLKGKVRECPRDASCWGCSGDLADCRAR
jgi:hypothetical protein